MTEAQMRADMEALMARLVQTEPALLDTILEKIITEMRGADFYCFSNQNGKIRNSMRFFFRIN